jgi:TPP-dependent pyruvate/acetoin dehydrogenase alpha subunit
MGSDHKGVFLEIFQKMCRARYFEQQVVEAHKKGLIHAPIYLSIGQESIPATASVVFKDCLIYAQHRNHSTYLSFGGDAKKLRDELLGKETGCLKGRCGSPCVGDYSIGMIPHHGLIGENIPLAVGAALGNKNETNANHAEEPVVLAFAGDAAYEEDYSLTAMGFAATHKLPICFICEDNDLSILTPVSMRRSWRIHDVTKGMGLQSYDLSDDPFMLYTIMRFARNPKYINVHTIRHRWHVGSGIDKEPEYDRLKLFREALTSLGFGYHVKRIEKKAKKEMMKLWRL